MVVFPGVDYIIFHQNNGISPNGRCYVWKTSLGTHSKLFTIALNMTISILHFTTMWPAMNYARIMTRHLKVKTNVTRVLGTRVLIYFICHTPLATLSLVSRYWYIDWLVKTTPPLSYSSPILSSTQASI